MPYERTESQLLRLTQDAIKDPEIFEGLNEANLKEADLREEIKRLAGEIWDTAGGMISSYDERESNFSAKKKEVEEQHAAERESPTESWDLLFALLRTARRAIATVLLVAVALSALISGFWTLTLGKLLTLRVALSTAATLIVLYVIDYVRKKRRQRHSILEANRKANAWNASQRDLTQLELELSAAREDINKLLREKINQRLRAYLNTQIANSFDPYLRILRAPGLAEVFDKASVIDTESQESLTFLIKNMPGGSIGIAGPRGAGKSTLLRLFCDNSGIVDALSDKPVLPVLVSAPVEYQPRDFILYLFSTACRSFLDYKKEPHDVPRESRESLAQSPVASSPFLPALRCLWPIFFYIGSILVLLGLTEAFLMTISSRQLASQQAAAAALAASAAPQPEPSPTVSPTPKEAGAPSSPHVLLQEWLVVTFLKSFGISPGTILTWGLLGVATGVLLAMATGLDFLTFLFSISPSSLEPFLRRLLRRSILERENRRIEALEELARKRRATPEAESLIVFAQDWLGKIRFQQSFTSGWSGALKLPIGLEGGINRARTLAENQLSLPEIVHAFTKFLGRVSAECQVFVGIDELDKLESDEKAERFLNEIKAVFGLDRCFYLMSVSENAMSTFERRGLPFRDVFDSSFDTIIYVNYLDFKGAQELIAKRIVGNPVPFVALSYCLSGGLARDMIRIFRSLIELLQGRGQQNDLETLCQKIVQTDFDAKLRAAAITARKIVLRTEVDDLLEELFRFEGAPLSEDSLLELIRNLFSWQSNHSGRTELLKRDKDAVAEYQKLDALREELATYFYYLLTVLQFFKNSLNEEVLRRKDERGKLELDHLATARQMMAISPRVTRGRLNRFRSLYSLSGTFSPTLPRARTGATQKSRVSTAVTQGLRSFLLSLGRED